MFQNLHCFKNTRLRSSRKDPSGALTQDRIKDVLIEEQINPRVLRGFTEKAGCLRIRED